MTKLSMVEFYIAKIESYLRRKHESILKVQDMEDVATSDNQSASDIEEIQLPPMIEKTASDINTGRSGDSDGSQQEFLLNQARKSPVSKQSVLPVIESEAESDLDADLVFYDKIQKLKAGDELNKNMSEVD
jgi:hypothetical protein